LSFQLLFFSPAWLLCSSAPLRDAAKPTLAQLNLHNTRIRRNPERLPSSRRIERAPEHRALHIILLSIRASDTALRLRGPILLRKPDSLRLADTNAAVFDFLNRREALIFNLAMERFQQ
jgi:hypothetical protein